MEEKLSSMTFFAFSGAFYPLFVGVTPKGSWCHTNDPLVAHQRDEGKEAKISPFYPSHIQHFAFPSVDPLYFFHSNVYNVYRQQQTQNLFT